MAKYIQAVASLGPRIELMKAASPDYYMQMITRRSTLSTGVVKNVQESEVEILIDLLKEGRSVHSGIAIFTPGIDNEGYFKVNVRVNKRILSALNARNAFTGKINNSENIGLSREQYIALWNQHHPEDPISPE